MSARALRPRTSSACVWWRISKAIFTTSTAHCLARNRTLCQSNSGHLRGNEREFVNDMASSTVWREPTERQAKWLRSILYRLGGRL